MSHRNSGRIEKHLHTCWDCRSRCNDLNGQALTMAALMRSTPFPGFRQEISARMNLLDRMRTYELQLSLRSDLTGSGSRTVWISAGVATVCLLLCSFVLFRGHRATPESLTERLAAITSAEESVAGTSETLHQTVTVSLSGDAATEASATRRIEVWSDRPHARYSTRVSSGTGHAEYAVWQPSAGVHLERTFNEPVVANRPRSSGLTLVDCVIADPSANALQAFETWMHKRAWRPILLAADFGSFVGPHNEALQMERTVRNGRAMIKLTARQRLQGRDMTMSMLVDSQTMQPASETLSFATARGHSEVKLAVHNDVVPSPRVSDAVFEPAPLPLVRPNLNASTISRDSASASPVDLNADEVLTLQKLHELGIARPNLIELTPVASDHLLLRLMVSTPERRQEVLSELSADRPFLKVEVQIAPADPVSAPLALPDGFSPNIVSALNQAYSEDLELIDLQNRFPIEKLRVMDDASRSSLAALLLQHLDGLQHSLRSAEELLGSTDNYGAEADLRGVAKQSSGLVTIDQFFAGMDQMDDELQRALSSSTSNEDRQALLNQIRQAVAKRIADLPRLRAEINTRYGVPALTHQQQ
jgi:hypothetical protein